MRITGGSARGHPIKVAGHVSDLRPAKDMVRQAVFNFLTSHFELQSPRVLDLFAGSGAFGLEALSRGAEFCLFVDSNRRICQTLQKTLDHSRFLGKAKVTCQDAYKFVPSQPPQDFDLIFLDPPYRLKMDLVFLEAVGELLRDEGILIYSHAKKTSLPSLNNVRVLDTRTYGSSSITYLTRANKDDKITEVRSVR